MSVIRFPFILRNRHFLAFDIIVFIFSAVFSFAIRLEKFDLNHTIWGIIFFLALSGPVKMLVFLLTGMYKHYWRNGGPNELLLVAFSCVSSGGVVIVLVLIVSEFWPESQAILPRSIPFIDLLLTMALVAAN